MTDRAFHPVAKLFPLMNGKEFDELKNDIGQNGLLEPIWLHPDGSIIDGRNRYRACMELGIEPKYRTWDGRSSLVSFVVSLNLHRRHLDTGQRAMIGLKVQDALRAEIAETLPEKGREAAERQWYGPETNGEGFINIDKTHSEPDRNAQAEAAASVNVATGTLGKAQQIAKHDPELAEKVATGEVKLQAAYRQVKHEQKQQAPPLPTDKYRVWYADPPWHYGNSGVIGDTDNYGHAERHYPTMTIEELCDLGSQIKENCEENAVLFLWVTSPLLEECFDVIRAWGFRYKTSFVWDKVKHNYGHYNSVRHELLLVCTRGSCTPDEKTLYDSVITISRSEIHSEKPDHFREVIDHLYPNGKRIELFAREHNDGWEMWGNEPAVAY